MTKSLVRALIVGVVAGVGLAAAVGALGPQLAPVLDTIPRFAPSNTAGPAFAPQSGSSDWDIVPVAPRRLLELFWPRPDA